ncbi:MAG: glycosyltransferase family 87 protein, partial [Stellaceae bacterium]
AAGRLADAGTPQLAYDRAAHYAAEQQATQPGITYNYFFYPPVFLSLCTALARLPYMVAFVIFEAATLLLYLLVARAILAERDWRIFVPLLAFPPVLWTIGLGQNALLTAALFGAATLLIDRRPVVAGLLFGALCYKPHFGLLVPVALIAGRRWPALAAACLSVAALSLLSLVLFGPQTWHAYLSAMTAARATYETGHISFAGYVTPFGAMMLRGAGLAMAYSAQIAASLAATAFVAVVWHRGLPLPIRAATLAAATLAAVPLALFYDLMIAAIAGLWLLRADGAYRLPDWGKVALAALFILTLDPRGLAQASHLPVGPLAALGMAALVATLALRPALSAPVAMTEHSARPTSNRLPSRP